MHGTPSHRFVCPWRPSTAKLDNKSRHDKISKVFLGIHSCRTSITLLFFISKGEGAINFCIVDDVGTVHDAFTGIGIGGALP